MIDQPIGAQSRAAVERSFAAAMPAGAEDNGAPHVRGVDYSSLTHAAASVVGLECNPAKILIEDVRFKRPLQ
jgi:hypothetical protein